MMKRRVNNQGKLNEIVYIVTAAFVFSLRFTEQI